MTPGLGLQTPPIPPSQEGVSPPPGRGESGAWEGCPTPEWGGFFMSFFYLNYPPSRSPKRSFFWVGLEGVSGHFPDPISSKNGIDFLTLHKLFLAAL
jgi:hypothetical protein